MGEASEPVGPTEIGQRAGKHRLAPTAVIALAGGDGVSQRGCGGLLAEHRDHQPAPLLIVLHKVGHDVVEVIIRDRVAALCVHLGGEVGDAGGEHRILVAESAQDGLHRHAGPVGDLGEGDVGQRLLDEQFPGRIQDPVRGSGRRGGPVGHVVGPLADDGDLAVVGQLLNLVESLARIEWQRGIVWVGFESFPAVDAIAPQH